MSSINGKFPKKVMPVFGGHGAQNQNHQRENNRNEQRGNGFDAADIFAPQKRNLVIDSGSFVPDMTSNYYRTAQWATETARPNTNVKIIAELSGSVPDGTRVQINIIHNPTPEQKNVYETIHGVIIGGVVSAGWQAKARGADWNQGDFTFLIIGGRASRMSTNALRLI
ncbi:MAG: hypothetical protein R2747_13650 [Pyrinomonadaceae bacterium]